MRYCLPDYSYFHAIARKQMLPFVAAAWETVNTIERSSVIEMESRHYDCRRAIEGCKGGTGLIGSDGGREIGGVQEVVDLDHGA